jgi:hypothetical protein
VLVTPTPARRGVNAKCGDNVTAYYAGARCISITNFRHRTVIGCRPRAEPADCATGSRRAAQPFGHALSVDSRRLPEARSHGATRQALGAVACALALAPLRQPSAGCLMPPPGAGSHRWWSSCGQEKPDKAAENPGRQPAVPFIKMLPAVRCISAKTVNFTPRRLQTLKSTKALLIAIAAVRF